MININPNNYLNDQKFYADLLSSLGLPNGAFNVQVLSKSGTFMPPGVTSATGRFYDIATAQQYNSASAVAGNKVYFGYLVMKCYCTAFVAGGDVTINLQTGISGALQAYIVEIRTLAAVDSQIGKDREFEYKATSFSFLNIVRPGADFSYVINYSFDGVVISF